MISSEIVRKMRNLSILITAVYLVFGLVLFLFPERVEAMIGVIVGTAGLIIGIYRLIMYLIRRNKGDMIAYDLIGGICITVLSVLCLIRRNEIGTYAAVLFGMLLLIGSSLKIQYAVDLHKVGVRRWWFILLTGGLSLAFSVLVMLNPAFVSRILFKLSGAFLIYDAATTLIAAVLMSFRYRKRVKAMEAEAARKAELAGIRGYRGYENEEKRDAGVENLYEDHNYEDDFDDYEDVPKRKKEKSSRKKHSVPFFGREEEALPEDLESRLEDPYYEENLEKEAKRAEKAARNKAKEPLRYESGNDQDEDPDATRELSSSEKKPRKKPRSIVQLARDIASGAAFHEDDEADSDVNSPEDADDVYEELDQAFDEELPDLESVPVSEDTRPTAPIPVEEVVDADQTTEIFADAPEAEEAPGTESAETNAAAEAEESVSSSEEESDIFASADFEKALERNALGESYPDEEDYEEETAADRRRERQERQKARRRKFED